MYTYIQCEVIRDYARQPMEDNDESIFYSDGKTSENWKMKRQCLRRLAEFVPKLSAYERTSSLPPPTTREYESHWKGYIKLSSLHVYSSSLHDLGYLEGSLSAYRSMVTSCARKCYNNDVWEHIITWCNKAFRESYAMILGSLYVCLFLCTIPIISYNRVCVTKSYLKKTRRKRRNYYQVL